MWDDWSAGQTSVVAAQRSSDAPEDLYLALLQKCLTRYLFYEKWRPIQPHASSGFRFAMYTLLQKLFASQQLVLMRPQLFDEEYTLNGGPWNNRCSSAETMIGIHRLRQFHACTVDVMRDQIPGDLIATGAWRGGATIVMRAVLKAYRDRTRRVWVADSFMGMPLPDLDMFPQDANSVFHEQLHMIVSVDDVKRNFAKYDLLDDQVRFLAGWFRDTLPQCPDRTSRPHAIRQRHVRIDDGIVRVSLSQTVDRRIRHN
jgi:O-methyltransferase